MIVIAPQFARIYAFSFEGAIYQLPRPPLFLVHGWGKAVNVTGGNRWKRPGTIDTVGLAEAASAEPIWISRA